MCIYIRTIIIFDWAPAVARLSNRVLLRLIACAASATT